MRSHLLKVFFQHSDCRGFGYVTLTDMRSAGWAAQNEAAVLLCFNWKADKEGVWHRHCLKSSGSTERPSARTQLTNILAFYNWYLISAEYIKQNEWELPISVAGLKESSVSLCLSLRKQTNANGAKAHWHLSDTVESSHLPCKPTMQRWTAPCFIKRGHNSKWMGYSAGFHLFLMCVQVLKTKLVDCHIKCAHSLSATLVGEICLHLFLFLLLSLNMSLWLDLINMWPGRFYLPDQVMRMCCSSFGFQTVECEELDHCNTCDEWPLAQPLSH